MKEVTTPSSPLLILIVGLPSSGKTSLAKTISKELGLTVISKDEIKELQFDTIGWKDREWSLRLDGASFDLLYFFIAKLLTAGNNCIVDVDFSNPGRSEARMRQIIEEHPCRILQINLICEGNVLLERFQKRSQDESRHAGHVDNTNTDEFRPTLLKGRRNPLDIPSSIMEIDTTDFGAISHDLIFDKIRTELN